MGTDSGAFRQNGALFAMAPAELAPAQVWLGRLPEDPLRYSVPAGLVTSGEAAEAAKWPPSLRDVWLLRRAFRRRILSDVLGIPLGEVGFVTGQAGKPTLLLRGRPCDWQFSSSHSYGLVGLALVRGFPLGLDLERCLDLPDQRRLSAGFPEPMASRLQCAPTLVFYRVWVAWEAVAKAVGCGLGPGLGRFLPVHPQGETAVEDSLRSHMPFELGVNLELRDTATGYHWRVTEVEGPAGYVGALAAPRPLSVEVREAEWWSGNLPGIAA